MLPDSDSDDDEDENLDDWSDKGETALTNENDVSCHEDSLLEATSSPTANRHEQSEDSGKHSDSDPEDTDTSNQTPGKRQSGSKMSGRPLKCSKKSNKLADSDDLSDAHKSFSVDGSMGDVKLMRKNLPVVRVIPVDHHLERASPALSSASEASSLTTSNGHSAQDIPLGLLSQLRKVNFTQKVTDIAADSGKRLSNRFPPWNMCIKYVLK